jgi:hypothetical protein
MRTPKTLTSLAAPFNGTVEVLTFRIHGKFLTGFAVVDPDKNELLEIEPIYYMQSGDRWMIKNKCTGAISYRKNMHGFTADIKPMHTGYVFNSMKY